MVKEYKLPVILHDREVMRYLDHKVVDDKIHVIWRKYTEYGSGYESHILQYAYFDCTSKTWSETIEPFGGHKYSGKMMYDWLRASLAGDSNSLYCTWYWTIGQKNDLFIITS